MIRQDSLFGSAEMAPRRASPVRTTVHEAVRRSERPAGWRAPTLGEHVCAGCDGAAAFGLGDTWLCRACVPAGFLPHTRGGAK